MLFFLEALETAVIKPLLKSLIWNLSNKWLESYIKWNIFSKDHWVEGLFISTSILSWSRVISWVLFSLVFHHTTCMTALIKVLNDSQLKSNALKAAALVWLDLSPAFDTVGHNIPLGSAEETAMQGGRKNQGVALPGYPGKIGLPPPAHPDTLSLKDSNVARVEPLSVDPGLGTTWSWTPPTQCCKWSSVSLPFSLAKPPAVELTKTPHREHLFRQNETESSVLTEHITNYIKCHLSFYLNPRVTFWIKTLLSLAHSLHSIL